MKPENAGPAYGFPRLVIGGTGSGCGKTTVTAAVLGALKIRGAKLAGFKCGPDYIDPMFHKAAIGVPSRNLDLFFADVKTVRAQAAKHIGENGVGIIEGAMGYYDGVSNKTDEASAAHIARVLEAPSVLVVRPKGQSLSLAAVIQGFLNFHRNTLSGIILNGITKGMYAFYKSIAEQTGLRVYGFLPDIPEAGIPGRHLGLVTADEIGDIKRRLKLLSDAAEESMDLDGLIELAKTAPMIYDVLPELSRVCEGVRIAVARDEAFCFYYEDNLDILRELGAELIFFSPVRDKRIPESADGLYIGGGYPELYAKELSGNTSMRESVQRAVLSGMPTVAECGGYQYLHMSLDGYPMAGILPFRARMTDKLKHFGYVTLTAEEDNLLCGKGGSIRAHEFHYGESERNGEAFTARKPDGRIWKGAHANKTLYAGYPHLYFRSNPDFAVSFVRECTVYAEKRTLD